MIDTTNEIDPADVVDAAFEPSEAAIVAGAHKLLQQARIYQPTQQQLLDARTSYRLEYVARAKAAVVR